MRLSKANEPARSLPVVEAKLHDESRLIQRCFDDNKDDDKGDDKKLKGQSKNEFKIESRTLQDSRGKLISRIKNQDSRIKLPNVTTFLNLVTCSLLEIRQPFFSL